MFCLPDFSCSSYEIEEFIGEMLATIYSLERFKCLQYSILHSFFTNLLDCTDCQTC